GQSLADADTNSGHTPSGARIAEPIRQGAKDPSARCAQRMPDGNGAAPRVDDVGIDVPRIDTSKRLHRKCLVELDRADVVPLNTGAFQRLIGRLNRGVTEIAGIHGMRGATGYATQ